MMRFALIVAVFLGAPAAAQERMDVTDCQGGWSAVMSMVLPVSQMPDTSVTDDGWCLITDFTAPMDNVSNFRISSFKWRATDIARLIEQGLPPRALEIEATGFGILPQTGDPVYDYLFGLQSAQGSTGFGLSVRWDGVQNVVVLDDAYFEFSPGNRIEATGRIDGVDLTDMTTTQMSNGSMGLTDLMLDSAFDGWFETFVAQPVGAALLQSNGAAPEVQVEALKDQAIQMIAQVPDAILPAQSRVALGAFIQTLPHPRGRARLQISADPGLGPLRLTPFMLLQDEPTLQQIIDLGLAGVSLLFTWSPTGDAR